ncbi:helix-turn-helix domain-containing protein [Streptomyces sp. NPDC001744]|uniref:helix-turn-helix domain-containing protein n=1 Tax=Streptomyces sp. NPDC001744 TaxID=3364606 RepID=UPI0036A00E2A
MNSTQNRDEHTVTPDPQASPSLGAELKAARRRIGVTQTQLADLSSVSVRTIRDLELDLTQNPRRETLRLLLDGLRLTGVQRARIEEAAAGPSTRGIPADSLTPPPAVLEPTIGRERDIEALMSLIKFGGHRLIRVVGMAGVGKSRLIQEVAGAMDASAQMPVVWAEPEGEPAGRPADRLQAHVAALLRGDADAEPDRLATAFGSHHILLVVPDATMGPGAEAALRRLLVQCRGLHVLYEAREGSKGGAGTDYPVFPLSAADRSAGPAGRESAVSPALRLMLSRCGSLEREALADSRVMAALAGICRSLDGIPRAIEAAAAWLLLYSPDQLLSLAGRDPFKLATPPGNDTAGLRAVLGASVTSLRPRDADVLRRLAAHALPWTMAQAFASPEQVGDPALGAVHLLCTRGLVRPAGWDAGGTPRFTVLNLVRHLLAESAAPAVPALESRGSLRWQSPAGVESPSYAA